eukprot:3554919-Amphidinium_carterae.1
MRPLRKRIGMKPSNSTTRRHGSHSENELVGMQKYSKDHTVVAAMHLIRILPGACAQRVTREHPGMNLNAEQQTSVWYHGDVICLHSACAQAVTLEPNCAKYYSNRSGAWSSAHLQRNFIKLDHQNTVYSRANWIDHAKQAKGFNVTPLPTHIGTACAMCRKQAQYLIDDRA